MSTQCSSPVQCPCCVGSALWSNTGMDELGPAHPQFPQCGAHPSQAIVAKESQYFPLIFTVHSSGGGRSPPPSSTFSSTTKRKAHRIFTGRVTLANNTARWLPCILTCAWHMRIGVHSVDCDQQSWFLCACVQVTWIRMALAWTHAQRCASCWRLRTTREHAR